MGEVTRRAAVLGSPIDHSLSPVLHTAGYEAAGLEGWEYTRIRCEADDLPRIVGGADATFRGFSVTMPCKFAALDFADEVTPRAREVGSANTLTRIDDLRWRADNTDTEGALVALRELLGLARVTEPQRAVMVGAGGSARAVFWALRELGIREITVVNRSDRSDEYAELASGIAMQFLGFDTDPEIIKAAAMDADVVASTVPPQVPGVLASCLGHAPLFDAIYDPWPTPLATHAASNGYPTVGGLAMLAGQAYSQFEQFTGVQAPREAMRAALR